MHKKCVIDKNIKMQKTLIIFKHCKIKIEK